MPDNDQDRKRWGRGTRWTTAELDIIGGNIGRPADQLTDMLPGRSLASIRQMAGRVKNESLEVPAVKQPGRYLEVLADYLAVDDPAALKVWLKWNGYSSHRVLSRDRLGWVVLECTAA